MRAPKLSSVAWTGPRITPCPRIAAAVDQDILPGDVAGVLRAQIRAAGAELCRPAVAFGGIGRGPRLPDLVEALAARSQHAGHVLALGVAVENPRQQIVDGDVARHRLPRQPADEADQARARAVRQAELGLRALHAARDDVDDAAEAARHHAVDGEADHLDRA